jgi:hypothetical protein
MKLRWIIIVALVIVGCFVLYKLGLYAYKKWNNKRLNFEIEERLKVPRQQRHAIMNQLLKIVTEIGNSTNTKPFFIYGTLLGQQRNNDFICWDYDLDYGIELDEFDIFLDTTPLVLQKYPGYELRTQGVFDILGIKMFQIVHIDTGINADISAFEREDGGTMYRKVLKMYSANILDEPVVDFSQDVFLPLQQVKFKDQTVYIPNKPQEYLSSIYGSSWRTPNKTCTCEFCVKK